MQRGRLGRPYVCFDFQFHISHVLFGRHFGMQYFLEYLRLRPCLNFRDARLLQCFHEFQRIKSNGAHDFIVNLAFFERARRFKRKREGFGATFPGFTFM